jgi:outer membrane receptor protein involved in Fe transport
MGVNLVQLGARRAMICATLLGCTGVLPISVGAQRVATASGGAKMRTVTLDITNAPLRVALRMIAQQAGLRPSYNDEEIPGETRVTVRARGVSIAEAFAAALQGTGLVATIRPTGNVFILRADRGTNVFAGGITGRVTDARTRQPLVSARISIDGVARTETGRDGTYRVTGVQPGTHTLTIKLIGFARAAHRVTVQEDIVTLDMSLDPAATALDQVVVTGTVVATEIKAVPNAITVVTAKEIEQRGITRIDQLFRGDVPGLFAMNSGAFSNNDEVQMFSRGATALSSKSIGVTNVSGNANTNPIKTYVDGVELAEARYLSHIDPRSIERIEILTGPQASTIYGSNAINGVMQIFTKRGTSPKPQFVLSLQSGLVQNDFTNATTPWHDHTAQLNGVEGKLSYSLGGSRSYMGPWTPSKQTEVLGGFGGVRLELPTSGGRVTTDLSLRRTSTKYRKRGDAYQVMNHLVETGWWANTNVSTGVRGETRTAFGGQTMGLTLGYAPTSWWSQEVQIGQDRNETEDLNASGNTALYDTTMSATRLLTDRRSVRTALTSRIPLSGLAKATLTAGADAWQSQGYIWSFSSAKRLVGDYQPGSIARSRDHNTGAFAQMQLGVLDRVFVTYGVRAEFNPAIGDRAKVLPGRYGITYAHDVASVTAKLRASYGRSIRPPSPLYKVGITAKDDPEYIGRELLPVYGNVYRQRPNPDLVPEYQQGGEGGIDLYFGARASLIITRYNQTVDGLIDYVRADSARSLQPNPLISGLPCSFWAGRDTRFCSSSDNDGYAYVPEMAYLNIGSIRNQGWEFQGRTNLGPYALRGTYSWTKSRTIGITPRYRHLFSRTSYPQYQPGAVFNALPEHTWALGGTYARARTTIDLNIMGTGRLPSTISDFNLERLTSSIRLTSNRQKAVFVPYVTINSPYAMADVNASHRLSARVEGVLRIQNIGDFYRNDTYAPSATMGRRSSLGFRIRL